MILCDNVGNEENWYIVQKFGFENKVGKSIFEVYRRQDFVLFFLGGVVCFLKKKLKRRVVVEKKKKVYCFFLLFVKINFLVYINGYFVFDYEVR